MNSIAPSHRPRRSFPPIHRSVRSASLGVIGLLLAAGLSIRPVHAQTYVVTQMETPAGKVGIARAVNNAGQVVGTVSTPGHSDQRAILWQDGAMQDLGTLGGATSSATAINGWGHVAGSAETAGGASHGFLYRDGLMIDLGNLTGHSSSAYALNDADRVVGDASITGDSFVHGFLFSGGVMRDLGTPEGWTGGAFGINAGGQIVGAERRADDETGFLFRSFLSDGTTRVSLPAPVGTGFAARAINDAGAIIGSMKRPSDSGWHACLYDTGGLHDLGTLGGSSSSAEAMNATGDVVGSSQVPGDGDSHGFLYQGGVLRDLNSMLPAGSGWMVETAAGINDRGQIAATGRIMPGGPWRALLLTPVEDERALPPTAPTRLTVGRGDLPFGDLRLTWIDTSNRESRFEIERRQGSGAWESVVWLPAKTTGYTDERLPRYQVYTYRVRSVNPKGASAWSSEAVADTGPLPVPILALTPVSLSFGPVPVGLSANLAVLLQNPGPTPVKIGSIAFEGPNAAEFTLPTGSCSGSTLEAGEICLLNVRFIPTLTDSRSASLVITDDATGSPHRVPLTGTGTAPLLTLSAARLLFQVPPAGDAGVPQTLAFTNNGDAPLTVDGIDLTGSDAGSFHIVSDSGQKNLDPGASRVLKITFSPASIASTRRGFRTAAAPIAAVSYNATLEIHHNDPHPGSPHQVTLTATTGQDLSPAAPVGLSTQVVSATEVDLSWTVGQGGNETGVTIFRRTGTGEWQRIGVVAPRTTRYADRSLTPATSYTYRLRTHNNTQVSAWTNPAAATTLELPPAAPLNLTTTLVSSREIDLAWKSGGGNETGVAIFRRTGTGEWQRIGVAGPHSTRYADRGVTPGTRYTYRVRSHNSTQVSAWTNPAGGVTP